jgi:hypothetical protein
MSGFPLYDNLIQQVPRKDLTVKQKEEVINNISIIDNIGTELIYALIYVYYLQNVSPQCSDIPFQGTKEQSSEKKNIYTMQWNLLDFPPKLRQLLYKFTSLHIKTLKEEDDDPRNILSE